MSFSSLSFILFFLPVSLIIYYLVPGRIKRYVLLEISLLFYAFGSLQYWLLLTVLIVVNTVLGIIICCMRDKAQNAMCLFLMTAGICINVAPLLFYKYGESAIRFVHADELLYHIDFTFPLGLSFFAFKAVSYLVDVYKGQVKNDPANTALYLSFFPQIISGPISRVDDFSSVSISWSEFSSGLIRFVTGYCKKILLADSLAHIVTETFSMEYGQLSTAYAWIGSICYSLQLFFDFSGYSDMAIGLSKIFGYKCPENFNYPYISSSVSEFWRRWHITLGSWFRDYIYIPLGGSRVDSKIRLMFNLLAVWLLTGMWHGNYKNFVFWGLAYFAVIAFEKLSGYPKKLKSVWTRSVYRFLVLIFVNFQWVIFRANGLKKGIQYIYTMIVPKRVEISDMRALFMINEYGVFIAAAIVLSMPIMPFLMKKTERNRSAVLGVRILNYVVLAALFIWSLSFVVAGANNPFAYANF